MLINLLVVIRHNMFHNDFRGNTTTVRKKAKLTRSLGPEFKRANVAYSTR